MRKGRDGEWKMENNGENSGPLTSLQVDRLTATNCNAAARANMSFGHKAVISSLFKLNIESKTSFTKVVQFGM